MAHPGSTVTNGATLEDCHTNIFVLTELNGLKWCRFSAGPSHQHVVTSIQDDPILCAYSRCLSQSLLCVWRRAPVTASNFSNNENRAADFRLSTEKELQVFWYGDEPDWKQLCVDSLKRGSEGSWETGVEYDTRTLLFKALHNLIERCLLTRGFVRIGRWFVKPLNFDDINDATANTQILAFSLWFFVHGENNVCVCVNVQQQPPVYRLPVPPTNSNDSGNSESCGAISSLCDIGGKRTVLLAPWSLKGCVNLDELKQPVDEETCAKRRETLREWSRFYPLPPDYAADSNGVGGGGNDSHSSSDSADLERQEEKTTDQRSAVPVVDVNVGGVRVQYPSCFVLLLPEDAERTWPSSGVAVSSSSSSLTTRRRPSANENDSVQSPHQKVDANKFKQRLVERVLEENTLAPKRHTIATSTPTTTALGTSDDQSLPSYVAASSSVWDFCGAEMSGGGAQKDSSTNATSSSSSCQCSGLQTTSAAPSCAAAVTAQVPNKAQLKFGLTQSATAQPGGKLRLERQAKLIKCGVFHRRSATLCIGGSATLPVPSDPMAYANGVSSDSRVDSGSPFSRPTSRPPPISLPGVSVAVSSGPATSSSIQMISPVSSANVSAPEFVGSGGQLTSLIQNPSEKMNTANQGQGQCSEPLTPRQQQFPPVQYRSSFNKSLHSSLSTMPSRDNNEQEYVQMTAWDGSVVWALKPNPYMSPFIRKIKKYPVFKRLSEHIDVNNRKRKKTKSTNNNFSSPDATLVDDCVDCSAFYPKLSDIDTSTAWGKRLSLLIDRTWDMEKDASLHAPVLEKNETINLLNTQQQKKTQSPLSSTAGNRAFQQSPNDNNLTLGNASISSAAHQAAEPSNHLSGMYTTVEKPPPYLNVPPMHNSYNTSSYLPDNIMADSSSNSGSDDENATFLSPPPSHGQEEETIGRKVKSLISTTAGSAMSTVTSVLSSQQALEQQSQQKRPSSMNCSNSCPPAVLDYGIIYPTPPSVDGTTQFSPESSTSTWHECHSHLGGIIASSTRQIPATRVAPISASCGASFNFHTSGGIAEQLDSVNKLGSNSTTDTSAISTVTSSISLGPIYQIPPVAKYVQSAKYASIQGLKSQQRLRSGILPSQFPRYKPKFLTGGPINTGGGRYNHMIINRQQHQQQFPFSTPLNFSPPFMSSHGFVSPHRVMHQQQQSPFCPPPPYHVGRPLTVPNCSAAASQMPFSSPPLSQPLRSFMAEQSPMTAAILNSPLNSHLARTPGAPDLQSPLSNASSHYGRNIGSIELGVTGSSVYAGLGCPEAHGLSLSLLLCDTFIDLHRDVVFDACPLCVCSMNIQGSEMGLYVVNSASSAAQANLDSHTNQWSVAKCSCGFSAVRNRYLSYKSGQFYEDEYDATGCWRQTRQSIAADDQLSSSVANSELIELIRHQSLIVDLTKSVSVAQLLTGRKNQTQQNAVIASSTSLVRRYTLSELELGDFAELCNVALEQASLVGDCTTPTRGDDLAKSKSAVVHSWGFLRSKKPLTSVDAMSVIRNLLPTLQESVQKPRGVWQSKHSVEGPLTWRQFHRKCYHRGGSAGREDTSGGPEPVPLFLASFEREWVTFSPFSLHYWDRLLLEPFGQTKDVAYVVVIPDSQEIVQKARVFFCELSKVYEGLRLGRHCPISRVLKDGFIRVGKTSAGHLSNKIIDQWFDKFEQQQQHQQQQQANANAEQPKAMSSMLSRIKLYAQVCRHHVAPYLAEQGFDRSIFREAAAKENAPPSVSSSAAPPDSSMPPPPAPSPSGFNAESSETPYADTLGGESSDNEGPPIPHSVVVYLINSFTFGAENEDRDQNRLSTAALFRCYLEILKDLPDLAKSNIQMQIIPLQTILEFSFPDESEIGDRSNMSNLSDTSFPTNQQQQFRPSLFSSFLSQLDYFRQLAFNVYAQSRTVGLQCLLSMQAKPLTAVGPAASKLELIKRKLAKMPGASYQMHCPLVILAPLYENSANHAMTVGGLGAQLSGCGAVTAGSVTAASSGNTDISARVLFLTYCLSEKQRWLLAAATDHQGALLENCVINLNVQNRWCANRRQVIGESLRKLWEFTCGLMATGQQPWRLVIGRLGRIGHDELKIWAHLLSKVQLKAASKLFRDQCGVCHSMVGLHETPSLLSACLISTEADAHFRVFPDSFAYDERFGQNAKQCPLSTPEDVSCTHILVFPTSALIQMHQGGAVSTSGIGQTDDIDVFGTMEWDITDGIDGGGLNMDGLDDVLVGQSSLISEAPDDSIQQQPLALGYIISTAPIVFAPEFFWSSCPSAKFSNPVHLRSSLHINTSRVQEIDDVNFGKTVHNHPLDSSLTTDVLRYILETYNALSWLSIDASSGDRRSCLPIHMQALCRLYKSIEKLL